jgi:hypothetical protein
MTSAQIRSTVTILALYSCLLVCACSTGPLKSLREIGRLRQQLIDKYRDRNINVNLNNGRWLVITFVNSPLNKETDAARLSRAQEAATFTSTNFTGIKGIESISVGFIESEDHFFIYHYSRSLGFFVFDKNGVAVNSGDSDENPLAPVVRFSSARNETDVSITRIQLDGDINNGIALVPHFTFKGGVRDPNRSAPESVVFDFASYADRKIYPGNDQLDIWCDGVSVFSDSARLLIPDTASDGGRAQFLTAQIPVTQFVKIGMARQIKLKLGSRNFDLSPDDVEALHSISSYISLPPAGPQQQK